MPFLLHAQNVFPRSFHDPSKGRAQRLSQIRHSPGIVSSQKRKTVELCLFFFFFFFFFPHLPLLAKAFFPSDKKHVSVC